MARLSSCCGLSFLFLALVVGSGKAETCSPESHGSCPTTDQTTLLQSRVGVTEAVLEADNVEDDRNGGLQPKDGGEDPSNQWAPEVEEEDSELAEGVEDGISEDAGEAEDEAETEDSEDDDAGDTNSACASFSKRSTCFANGCAWSGGSCEDDTALLQDRQDPSNTNTDDTNTDCGLFTTEAHCHKGGCSWSGDSCELDGSNPDDTNVACPSFLTESHCTASGCLWSGDSCKEDGRDKSGALLQMGEETDTAYAGNSQQISSRWCRRRRVHRRRRISWGCRRRRAPKGTKAVKDGYHQECKTKGMCTDNGKKICAWCGQHKGELMYCCNSGSRYAKGHACNGAKFKSGFRSHHCVTPSHSSTPQQYKWLDLSSAKAKQSTTAHGGAASRAIDGSASTSWAYGSCTHTRSESKPWFEVDLGTVQTIKAIAATNRGDCCGSRLSGFSVRVGSNACATGVAIAQGETKVVKCEGVGSKVRLEMAKRTPLTICEFRIATPATQAPTTEAPIVAPTTQAPTPASTKKSTVSPTTKGLFDSIDGNANRGISRAELQKAIDAGKIVEGTAAPATKPPATVAPTTKAPSSGILTLSQKDAIVKKHNALRAGLGASDMMKMTWDDTLANAAQQYVSGLSLLAQQTNVSSQKSQKCPRGHSQNRANSVGENMAWKWSSSFQPADLVNTDFTPSVQSWYDEIKDAGPYKTGGRFGGFGKCSGVCGHYTQVVWAAENKIGCGAAYCPHSTGMGGYELVCQYGTSVSGGYGGNMGGATVFTTGTACSKCPSNFMTCSSNLCA